MQLTPLSLLISQCETLTRRLEALDAQHPRAAITQPLFAVCGLQTDLQRVYAIEQVLIRLEALTNGVQAEVANAIWDLLETIAITYRQSDRMKAAPKLRERKNRAKHKGRGVIPALTSPTVKSERNTMI